MKYRPLEIEIYLRPILV